MDLSQASVRVHITADWLPPLNKVAEFSGIRSFFTVFLKKFLIFHILSQKMRSMHPSISKLSSHVCIGLASGVPPPGSSTRTKILFALLQFPVRATCPAHHVFINFTARIFGDERTGNEANHWTTVADSFAINIYGIGSRM
jgi:hypothetical protein